MNHLITVFISPSARRSYLELTPQNSELRRGKKDGCSCGGGYVTEAQPDDIFKPSPVQR